MTPEHIAMISLKSSLMAVYGFTKEDLFDYSVQELSTIMDSCNNEAKAYYVKMLRELHNI